VFGYDNNEKTTLKRQWTGSDCTIKNPSFQMSLPSKQKRLYL